MLELFTKKTKKVIGIAALTCFLATPISYTMSVSSAAAAALDNQIQFDQRHEPRHDRDNDRWDKDKKRPPKNDRWDKDKNPPPRHDRDKDRWDKDKKNPPPPPPRHDRDKDRWDKDKKNPPPPPPRHDRDKDRWDRDDDKDYDKGDITTAVLVGGVIGAIIAKNT
ncbi:Uncharacterised protein [Megamonas hypermegale]|uniref:Uncharacterized protein n=1 Tax=Megamonas hypermegale TaxID=158847 RepID=A0A239TP66_9FIRM|nr:hypothetical protein [Megamonas hypermegale]SNU99335.1 Uncharacterised protein [Megamonas hypermegale]